MNRRILLWRDAKQPAGIGVFEHPDRAVRSDLDVANAVADAPALRRRRATLTVERDPVERLRGHAAEVRDRKAAADPDGAAGPGAGYWPEVARLLRASYRSLYAAVNDSGT